MVQFVSLSIKRAAASIRSGENHSNLATQSLDMSLNILMVHLTRADLPTEDWVKMIEVMEDLDTLADHENERISIISSQLHRLIATQKVVIDEIKNLREATSKIEAENLKMKSKVQEMKQIKVDEENKLMDERKEQLKQKSEELKKQKEQRKHKAHEFKSQYEEALFHVSDPLLPVQGHGLISLTRLVEERDPVTLDNIDRVRLLFQANLADEDTYIYLSSIAGLVACASHRPELVLECLTKEFSQVLTKSTSAEAAAVAGSEDEVMAVRTKVGEALVKITRDLGELTPHYKNLLLNAFFSAGMNDPDPLVRASSLSKMGEEEKFLHSFCFTFHLNKLWLCISGEVCKNLWFSLGPITGELLPHLSCCSRNTAAEVWAAVVLMLTLTLQGLGRDAVTVLQTELRDVYRELKLLAATEREEVVRAHISLALQELTTSSDSSSPPTPASIRRLLCSTSSIESYPYIVFCYVPNLFACSTNNVTPLHASPGCDVQRELSSKKDIKCLRNHLPRRFHI